MKQRVIEHGQLAVGQMKAVKVGSMPVLLVRTADAYHALPGRCTHRPRPLVKGTLHGTRLMCPRHQAAFDVRTGDALEPPALDGLPTFDVDVEDGGVFVTVPEGAGDRRLMPLGGRDPDDERLFVIVGAGGAGAVAAETLRGAGYGGRLVMLSRESHRPYDRPHCSAGLLTGRLASDELPLRDDAFYAEHGIERRHGTVVGLDAGSRALTLEDGEEYEPDAVLVATGGTPNRLPVPGGDLEGVFTLRSIDDGEEILAAARGKDTAVVIGASFIGLEVAASLRELGIETTVVAPEQLPLERVFGARVGRRIQRLHEDRGVRFRLGSGVAEIRGDAGVDGVALGDGEELSAHFVVLGVGVRPASGFVRGLELERDGGVAVDDQFRALGAAGVWAAGDVAHYPDPYTGRRVRVEHWRIAQQQGKAAALSMVGKGSPFHGVPFFWTQQYRLAIGYVGIGAGWDDLVIGGDVEADDFIAYYLEGGVPRAAAGTRETQLGAFAELMRIGRVPSASDLRRRPELDLRELLAEE